MLTELCQELKNWFADDEGKIIGTFTISDGVITPSIDLQPNQYYRIVGSVFNDGVHKNDEFEQLVDESFDGAIWLMKVPQAFVDLANDVQAWKDLYGTKMLEPYTSESFGGYSYSKAISSSGGGYTWQDAFRKRLNAWRKV